MLGLRGEREQMKLEHLIHGESAYPVSHDPDRGGPAAHDRPVRDPQHGLPHGPVRIERMVERRYRRMERMITAMSTVVSAGLIRRQRSSAGHPVDEDMAWIAGGTFRMGSDRHYPEEAPAHRVAVDGFWIDRTPVTNRAVPPVRRGDGTRDACRDAAGPEGLPGRPARTCSMPARWCSAGRSSA